MSSPIARFRRRARHGWSEAGFAVFRDVVAGVTVAGRLVDDVICKEQHGAGPMDGSEFVSRDVGQNSRIDAPVRFVDCGEYCFSCLFHLVPLAFSCRPRPAIELYTDFR